MAAATSSTRWRDESILPQDYEDVATLIRVARQARGRLVKFDWAFTRDDLWCLRRAVYEWGSGVAGRYRTFDARVLAAINDALGETDTVFVLNEPKTTDAVDCKVTCVQDGDGFRLQGHAPFDIVFGYGSAGIEQDTEVSVRLGPTVQETLANAVGMLGWDLRRLQEKCFQPVKNVLYGLRVNYGIQEIEPAAGPATDVQVHFHGPFSALNEGGYRCLFTDEIADRVGVYLWTIDVSGEQRVWYVGQTERGFGTRTAEHLANSLSGKDTTWDAAALSHGEHRLADGAIAGEWPATLCSFLRNYEGLVPDIISLIRLVSIHVAPLADEERLYNRVEGAIGRYYKTHPNRDLRDFVMPGLRVPTAIQGVRPIRLVLSSDVPIAGLPPHLLT